MINNEEISYRITYTYSLINESPFSQMSTILALGLHSDITNFKASAKQKPKISKFNTKTHSTLKRIRNDETPN